ncbi:Uncharacterised protein [Leclercia adecarboxylata]|uniref:Uncharacterized protein n=1 Tax=Leclercia adecarboxylata TaxID=83655 RepID=A0A4U9IAJ2_9ENTR|nr:Uncharacterised protein [Leclercia adecarboxylata]
MVTGATRASIQGLSAQQIAHKGAEHILLMQRSVQIKKDYATLVIGQTLLLWIIKP